MNVQAKLVQETKELHETAVSHLKFREYLQVVNTSERIIINKLKFRWLEELKWSPIKTDIMDLAKDNLIDLLAKSGREKIENLTIKCLQEFIEETK